MSKRFGEQKKIVNTLWNIIVLFGNVKTTILHVIIRIPHYHN